MSTAPAVDEYKAQPIPWVSDEEWHARTNPDRDPNEAGLDPVWRIANLYQIKDRTGKFVPFVPKPEQRVLIWDLHVRKLKNIIDIKARRLGMSTYLVGIEGLDRTLFVNGHKGMLIDKTAIDARIKLKDMVRVAWDRLDPKLKLAWKVNFAAEQVTALQAGKVKNDGESTFRVAVSGRGGEAHYLVVSEWGTIQFEDQSRSTEINSGAMEAAAFGTRVIETTWKGGKGGDVWAYVEKALQLPDEQKNPAYDWYIRFFPWYVDPEYALVGDYNRISPEVHAYLDTMERETGTTFTAQQRFWYWHKEGTARRTMKREYPTVLRECWEAPVEGAIYGEEIEKARTGGRIVDFQIDLTRPVDLFFDLGAPANTACWYIQHIEGVHHVIDYEAGLDLTLRQRIQHVKAKGFQIGTWYIPHDGGALQKGGISYQTELMAALREANMPARVVIVPRTRSVWTGIDALLTRFRTLKFHATRTKKGIECLEAYRRRPDPSREGAFLDEVVNDWSNHSCDALRTFAEASLHNYIPSNSDSIMTNAYFDPAIITRLSSEAVGRHSSIQMFTITRPQHAKTAIPLRDNEHGWLRVWERERLNSSYIITMTGRALAVWRSKEQDQHGAQIKAALVAAVTPDNRILPSQLITWAGELSEVYGGCMVVPDVDTLPSSVEALTAIGTPLYSRKVPRHDQRVGQGQPVAKPGWDMTEEKYRQAMVELQAMLTADQLAIHCPTTLDQLTAVIRDPEGNPVTQEGYQCDWAEAAAMAALTIPQATLWQARPAPLAFNPHHNPDNNPNQFDQWGGQLAIGG